MRRILFSIYVVISALISVPIILFLIITNKRDRFYSIFLRAFSRGSLKILNIDLRIKNKNDLHNLSKTLIVANHLSIIDIMVLVASIDQQLIFISKKENRFYPIVSTWMKYNQTIFIDRKNPRNAIRSIQAGAKLLKDNKNVVIFPQGTRSDNIEDFKPGSLKIAQKAKANILPVGIKNTNHIFDNLFSYQKCKIDVYIHSSISYDMYKDEDLLTLQQKIQEDIYSDVK